MSRRTRSTGTQPVRAPLADLPWRDYVPARWEPPRPGSMHHLELPSLAGGVRYYPRRPWAATDK